MQIIKLKHFETIYFPCRTLTWHGIKWQSYSDDMDFLTFWLCWLCMHMWRFPLDPVDIASPVLQPFIFQWPSRPLRLIVGKTSGCPGKKICAGCCFRRWCSATGLRLRLLAQIGSALPERLARCSSVAAFAVLQVKQTAVKIVKNSDILTTSCECVLAFAGLLCSPAVPCMSSPLGLLP